MKRRHRWFSRTIGSAEILVVGWILIASSSGCTSEQPNENGNKSGEENKAQTVPPPLSLSAQSPEQIASQNSSNAAQLCQSRYRISKGSLFKLELCVSQAKEKYLFPFGSGTENAIASEYWNNILAAAKQVDEGYMTTNEFNRYSQLCKKIMEAKFNEKPISFNPPPDQPSKYNNLLGYAETNGDYATVANIQRQIAITNLEAQRQNVLDDKYEYEYEYCAGLHSKKLTDCQRQQTTFYADLETYRAMALSVPQEQQSIDQSTSNNLQLEDIQDDLDAITGGVLP